MKLLSTIYLAVQRWMVWTDLRSVSEIQTAFMWKSFLSKSQQLMPTWIQVVPLQPLLNWSKYLSLIRTLRFLVLITQQTTLLMTQLQEWLKWRPMARTKTPSAFGLTKTRIRLSGQLLECGDLKIRLNVRFNFEQVPQSQPRLSMQVWNWQMTLVTTTHTLLTPIRFVFGFPRMTPKVHSQPTQTCTALLVPLALTTFLTWASHLLLILTIA